MAIAGRRDDIRRLTASRDTLILYKGRTVDHFVVSFHRKSYRNFRTRVTLSPVTLLGISILNLFLKCFLQVINRRKF